MSEMDVSAWKSFRVGDLFEKLTLKYKGDHPFQKALDLSTVITDEFNLPLVNAKLGDNGVMYYGRESDWESSEMTLDIVEDGAASVGTVYAQPQLTGVLYNAYLIKLKVGTTANCLLFVSAVMECCIKQHFSYSNKCTWAKVEPMMISLPATPDDTPDWDYMENYMKAVMEREEMFAEHLASLAAEAVADGHEVDVSKWGEFRVGDLFDIRPTKSLGKTNQYLFDDNGQVPVVVNSAQNNGIGGYTTYTATENGGIITFSDTTDANSIFYQHEPFVGYSHVQGMYPKCDKWSETSMLFFVGVFKACALDMGFSYANKFRRDLAANLIVKLPVTPARTPDWAYMERFMQQQMDKSRQLVEHLDKLF